MSPQCMCSCSCAITGLEGITLGRGVHVVQVNLDAAKDERDFQNQGLAYMYVHVHVQYMTFMCVLRTYMQGSP